MRHSPSWTGCPDIIRSVWTRRTKSLWRSAHPKAYFATRSCLSVSITPAQHTREPCNTFFMTSFTSASSTASTTWWSNQRTNPTISSTSEQIIQAALVIQLRMNLVKCAFGVKFGKFLEFIIHHWGFEINQTKIDAIQKMLEPRNILELKSFKSHLAYIWRFISNLARRCQPFSRLMKKDACRNAFNSIKAYLTKPPLVPPIIGKPLLFYIAAQANSVGALLAQYDENNKEQSLYYWSQTLVGAEIIYMSIQKICLALIFTVQKLWPYLLAHSMNLISHAGLLKAIKGQALGYFLAGHPVPTEWELIEEFLNEEIFLVKILPPWKMYFHGAARRNGAGAVLFISPKDNILPHSFVLTQNCSNNMAEYQALSLPSA
ncbi:hypothetical protein H6P81_010235 [Aristolochia fimbriata]|uniref:Reverse transcriptase/retrotransposon-derived protein RNase H-like domain-containing protein n=1 Tax=Aristolochia fimbriata TaxID=158543 RepID=A0AAV7EN71_ARIFI|nr:hypothetical protein H6P81_010235 [Aristolochia fimbriata]